MRTYGALTGIGLATLVALALVGCNRNSAGQDSLESPVRDSLAGQIPASLRSDAYVYGGYGFRGTMNFQVTGLSDDPLTGVQTMALLTPADQLADASEIEFETRRTGGLSRIGNEIVRLDAEGMSLVSSTVTSVREPVLVMPANFREVGTWETENEVEVMGERLRTSTTSQVIGEEEVTTPAGTFNALRLEQTGTWELLGEDGVRDSGEVRTVAFLVPGLGAVRVETKRTSGGGADLEMTIELTSYEEEADE